MSSLIVEVCAVEEVQKHPNADRLEMVRVKNWWCVSGIGNYHVGDKVVYIPPDSVLTEEVANKWGIANYCAPLPKMENGDRPAGFRVRACRLRGQCSFGTIQQPDDPSWPVGHDVREYYGITKFEPPVKSGAGDAAPPLAGFHAYTDIENLGNFPGVFEDGEEVYIDEKIHGTNCRVGVMLLPHEDTGELVTTFVAGSHSVRRKKEDEKGRPSLYWMPLQQEVVEDLLLYLFQKHNRQPVILFGEIYGAGVQDMQYGQGGKHFRAFDISCNGAYMDCEEKLAILKKHGVEAVPHIYHGPFSMEKVRELVDGPTLVCKSDEIKEAFKGREGIVIRPAKERENPSIGRVILKYISVDYHERKNAGRTEDH